MSRHKLVKNLDLDDELDDYDGGDDYGYDGTGPGGEGILLSLSCRD
jgi:elongation factor 1 alpha-like protein